MATQHQRHGVTGADLIDYADHHSGTMATQHHTLLRVVLPKDDEGRDQTAQLVDELMGKKPEKRFEFIRDNAKEVSEIDV